MYEAYYWGCIEVDFCFNMLAIGIGKQITRPSSLRQRVFYFVLVSSHAAQGYIMQLVMPSVVPMAVRMVTSV